VFDFCRIKVYHLIYNKIGNDLKRATKYLFKKIYKYFSNLYYVSFYQIMNLLAIKVQNSTLPANQVVLTQFELKIAFMPTKVKDSLAIRIFLAIKKRLIF